MHLAASVDLVVINYMHLAASADFVIINYIHLAPSVDLVIVHLILRWYFINKKYLIFSTINN